MLLLDTDILIIKVMQLMMEKMKVNLHVASNIPVARATMALLPCQTFDAVIVVPNNHRAKNLKELREFSEFICQAPYKIPMLGAYFDLDARNQEPGYYIHGIIPRPLDEKAFKGTLLEWRLTARLWRKVAASVEALEGPQEARLNATANQAQGKTGAGAPKMVNRNQATMDRKTGAYFASQLMSRLQDEQSREAVKGPSMNLPQENSIPPGNTGVPIFLPELPKAPQKQAQEMGMHNPAGANGTNAGQKQAGNLSPQQKTRTAAARQIGEDFFNFP